MRGKQKMNKEKAERVIEEIENLSIDEENEILDKLGLNEFIGGE